MKTHSRLKTPCMIFSCKEHQLHQHQDLDQNLWPQLMPCHQLQQVTYVSICYFFGYWFTRLRKLTYDGFVFLGESVAHITTLEAQVKRIKPLQEHVATLQATILARDAQIAFMEQSLKRLQERVDMPLPNELWSFIQGLMDKIDHKDRDIIILNKKYEREKTFLTSHRINTNDVSGEVTLSRHSSGSRRTFRSSQASSSVSSVQHQFCTWTHPIYIYRYMIFLTFNIVLNVNECQ